MKRPAFQFYPADWRKDTALQSCSIAARGLWQEILCLAHECEPYGHLTVVGNPMTVAELAQLAHVGLDDCERLLAELERKNIFSRRRDGTIYSRRMVRDEMAREARASGGHLGSGHGGKGGRPKKTSAKPEGFLKTPSSVAGKPLHGEKANPLDNPPSSSSSDRDSTLPSSIPAARAVEDASGFVGWLLEYLANPNLAVQRGLTEVVREWRATGLSDHDIRACIVEIVEQRRSAQPGWSPDSLRYLTPGIKRAAEKRSGNGAADAALPVDPDDERVRRFKETGFWMSEWDEFKPDDARCSVSISILRKHGYRS